MKQVKTKKFPGLFPVILAGGSGTRLWPVSRESYPKQFTNLLNEKSLFQKTAERFRKSDLLQFETLTTITNSEHRFIAREQLQLEGYFDSQIFLEPSPKNTAPAILVASLAAYAKNPEAIMYITPSDHFISSKKELHATIYRALEYANQGQIVTFGVVPTYPETGYGYLQLDDVLLQEKGASPVTNFIEKPSNETAQNLLLKGGYYWNSGNFLFQASTIIAAFEKFAPETLKLSKLALDHATKDLSFIRLDEEYWDRLISESIDYEIMEKANNLTGVISCSVWSDLGSWESIWKTQEKHADGMVTAGSVVTNDCSNSLMHSSSNNQLLVGLGIENMIVVAMPDAVLVADKDRTQDVKKLVSQLKNNEHPQASIFPKDHRPWGWFESLARADRFQVKQIFVQPGQSLSLQSHHHRSEHWVVVEGTAEVTINGGVELVKEGQSVYVPLGAQHRLANPGKVPIVLIEVQIGTYLEEDDIIRYEDEYDR